MAVMRITRADIDLAGLLAGSTTNPPALAFATNVTGSDSPTLAYATVYP
jgi:putative transport protein